MVPIRILGCHNQGPKRQELLTDTLIVLLHDSLRDHRTDIASLGDIFVESKLDHKLIQNAGDVNHCHIFVDGDFSESVARHGGNNKVVWQRRRVSGVLFLDLAQDWQELKK